MNRQWFGGVIVIMAAASAVVAPSAVVAVGGTSVYINGTKASSRVKMISGVAYVPLADVAKAYSSQVNKRPDGDFDLGPAGGAYQVGKYQGKQGQEVFTGQYRFSVTAVEEARSYTTKYKARQDTIEAESPSNKLVIVSCRIKNGMRTKQSLLMTVGGNYGSPNTALTTQDEQSLPPINWHGDSGTGGVDVMEDLHAPAGINILPGAARNVNLVFLVPKDTQIKDLIFCLTPYDQYSEGDKKKFTDVRISLNPPTGSQ